MKTNEQIFAEIAATGYITESDISLLKRRSNKAQKDLFDYSLWDNMDEIKIYPDQGSKALNWLKKFLKKEGIYGWREIDIIESCKPEDFCFKGFYDVWRGFSHNYIPYYEVGGMEYIPLSEPYIVG